MSAADSYVLLQDFVSLINQIIPVQVDAASIGPATTLAGDLAIDSISLVSLMTLCEEFFEVSLGEHAQQIANIETVGQALELISSVRNAPAFN
jgi:acyl carrier protein